MIVKSPCLYSVTLSFISILQNIITFVITGFRQTKTFKKTTRFGYFNSQGTQNTEMATERCSTEVTV